MNYFSCTHQKTKIRRQIASLKYETWMNPDPLMWWRGIIIVGSGGVEDGGGVRHEHRFSPKYIKNTSSCETTPTEHLLNTGRSPQSLKKAN